MKLLAQRRICEIAFHSLANERCNFVLQSIAEIDIYASARKFFCVVILSAAKDLMNPSRGGGQATSA